MPVQFNVPPMLLLGPLLAAVVVYVMLRWVIWAPRAGTSPATVSEHALWVGVIGWLASSLQGAMNLGIIPANPYPGPDLTSAEQIFPALAWPVLGCLGVHALGQVSYPGPRRLRRQAVLAVRHIRDFLPRRLALVATAIFAAAGGCIAWTATLPGFASVAPVNRQDGAYNYYQSAGGDGRIPGSVVAGWLGGALLVLAVGTGLVLWLISRRRQLESLDAADNAALRTIAMNRLLRTVSTVAAGLGVIAGNFAARPDPSSGTTSWTNPAGIVGTAVLLAMWWWRPPRLAAAGLGVRNRPESGLDVGRQHPAARWVSSLGPLLGLAAAVPLVAGAFLAPVLAAASFGLAGVVALMAGLVLLAIAAGELLLQRNYGAPDAPRTWPRQPVGPALLTTAVLALLLFVLVLVITAQGQARLGGAPDWIPVVLLTAGICAVSLPAFLAARLRQAVPDLSAGMDAALRAITIHRTVRTLAAALTAQAAVLLLTHTQAWAAVLGLMAFGETDPAAGSWWPASLAGAVLGSTATVIAVIPVRMMARTPAAPAPQPDKEHAT